MTEKPAIMPAQVEIQRDPNDVLDSAIRAAKALQRVISQKPRPVIINGEQFLEFEDWQTLGQFYGYTVRTMEARPVEIGGVHGAYARAELVDFRTGEVIGGADGYCMRDEPKWGDRPWFQLASMAQTRAGAKALRNRLAWVAVLAGYRPTPAEEIEDTEPGGEPAQEHWCPIHNVPFKRYEKGGAAWYSHRLDDGTYCNERAQAPASNAQKSAAKPAQQRPAQSTGDPERQTLLQQWGQLWNEATIDLKIKPTITVSTSAPIEELREALAQLRAEVEAAKRMRQEGRLV